MPDSCIFGVHMRQPILTLTMTAIASLLLTSSCAMQKFARKYYHKAKQDAPYDVVIIPGIPYSDSTNTGLIFASRILWSKYLYDHGIVRNIIYSGSAVSTPYYEGRAMKSVADSLGIPPEHTFAEIRAEHSTENAWYSMKMAHKMGFKKIAIASDAFQIKLLKRFLKKRCDNMTMIPTIYDSLHIDRNNWQKSLPPMDFKDYYAPHYIPLASRESFWERWRGTRGKHINFDDKD